MGGCVMSGCVSLFGGVCLGECVFQPQKREIKRGYLCQAWRNVRGGGGLSSFVMTCDVGGGWVKKG